MNLLEIDRLIAEAGKPYADKRTHLFDVRVSALEAGRLRLEGRVLEEAAREALVTYLANNLPGIEIEAQAVEVARRAPPRLLTVSTNLTSVHAGTSFLSEQVTQLYNGMVVEQLWEQGRWCFVRLEHGYLGWTYRPYLTESPSPEATHLVTEPVSQLREAPRGDAALVTRVLGGTSVSSAEQAIGWARLELAGGLQGWLPASSLREFAALPVSAGARREQMMADAQTMTGVPYLWGGCSANGIDCSGFAQLLHRWVGLAIPRDADMQYQSGLPVEPPFLPGDLLFFGEAGEQRSITHVGISMGGWRMIHSSRSRNGVQVDDVQAVEHLRTSYLCAATYIAR